MSESDEKTRLMIQSLKEQAEQLQLKLNAAPEKNETPKTSKKRGNGEYRKNKGAIEPSANMLLQGYKRLSVYATHLQNLAADLSDLKTIFSSSVLGDRDRVLLRTKLLNVHNDYDDYLHTARSDLYKSCDAEPSEPAATPPPARPQQRAKPDVVEKPASNDVPSSGDKQESGDTKREKRVKKPDVVDPDSSVDNTDFTPAPTPDTSGSPPAPTSPVKPKARSYNKNKPIQKNPAPSTSKEDMASSWLSKLMGPPDAPTSSFYQRNPNLVREEAKRKRREEEASKPSARPPPSHDETEEPIRRGQTGLHRDDSTSTIKREKRGATFAPEIRKDYGPSPVIDSREHVPVSVPSKPDKPLSSGFAPVSKSTTAFGARGMGKGSFL